MSNNKENLELELAELKNAVKNFVDKANDNVTSLWKADLSETEECIVLFPCSIKSDPDDENTLKEFDGIQEEFNKLEKLIK